jgi:solute carrier family 25 folate transporter 32
MDTHAVSGAVAGCVATLILHPLDLIKTRFHVQERGSKRLPKYSGLLDACRTIYRLESWRGFYGGLLPNIVGNTASWGVYMYAYNRCKDSFARRGDLTGSALYLSAATVAGTATTLLLHPVFMVKTRLQLQMNLSEQAAAAASASGAAAPANATTAGSSGAAAARLLPVAQRDNYAGSVNAVRRIVAEEGVLSLYRGMGPSMLLVSHGSIQFLAYEQCKAALLKRRVDAAALLAASKTPTQPGHSSRTSSSAAGGSRPAPALPRLDANDLLVASTTSKVCAILATYPYQVVRSCMQQRARIGSDTLEVYATTHGTVRHIWRLEGPLGFYRGIFAHMLRSTPQATLTLMLYEYGNRLLSSVAAATTRTGG